MMDRHFWLVYACLAAVGLVLGYQTQQAVGVVLSGRPLAPASGVATEAGDRVLLDELDRKDRLFETPAVTLRDPFTVGASAGRARPVERRERPAPPSLQALLYEERSPVVQLRSGRGQSGWLGVGGVYDGWTIEEITAHAVRVSRQGSSVVLARP